MLLPELIHAKPGSNLVKIGRAHSYSIVTLFHSLTQQDSIVALPPTGAHSHKN